MATDQSEPRVGLIAKVGALAIVSLIVIHAMLVAYFDRIAQAEEHRKFGDVKPEALMSHRADELARLTLGTTPIDKAMQQVAARGRMAASPDIAPSASRDVAPLQGWSQMPADVPSPMMAPEAPPSPSTQPANDAGAALAADSGLATGNRPSRTRPDGGPAPNGPAKHP